MPGVSKESVDKLGIECKDDETCATFILQQEDHTLGNALRYVMTKNRDVEFCGYSVPHPTESIVNLRVQTTGIPATQALRQSLVDLAAMCDVVKQSYIEAVDNSMTD